MRVTIVSNIHGNRCAFPRSSRRPAAGCTGSRSPWRRFGLRLRSFGVHHRSGTRAQGPIFRAARRAGPLTLLGQVGLPPYSQRYS
jgi:hypothetical protein